jgi:NAD(P)-dependent dehydrogenase (short-subunit alcohol dehydrogenase family)
VTARRLERKVAFISGAAGSIGAATARAFVAEGARVVVSELDAAALDAPAGELGSQSCAAAVADVTDSAQIRAAIATAVERFGGLDVVFANAGIFGEVAAIVDYPEDVFDRVLAVNVRGPFFVSKHALAVMRANGSLILNSSVVGLTSDPHTGAYATSKHALVGLMRTAAKEAAWRGIRVTRSIRGPSTTTSSAASKPSRPARRATAPPRSSSRGSRSAAMRASRRSARAAVFLASDDSAFITGATIPVDGGMSI